MLVQNIAEKGECQKNSYRHPAGLDRPERDFEQKEEEDKKDDSICLEAAYGRKKENKKNIKKNLYFREQDLS